MSGSSTGALTPCESSAAVVDCTRRFAVLRGLLIARVVDSSGEGVPGGCTGEVVTERGVARDDACSAGRAVRRARGLSPAGSCRLTCESVGGCFTPERRRLVGDGSNGVRVVSAVRRFDAADRGPAVDVRALVEVGTTVAITAAVGTALAALADWVGEWRVVTETGVVVVVRLSGMEWMDRVCTQRNVGEGTQ